MEVGRQTTAPKSKGKGKSTKQPAVLKTDNRTETPEIKKDDGVENPDKDALESTADTTIAADANTADGPDVKTEGAGVATPTGEVGKQETAAASGGNSGASQGEPLVVDIEQAGTGRFVDETLDEARQNEKVAFQNLINENVKTQNELDKTSAKLTATEAQLQEKNTELEAEQEKSKELQIKIGDLELTIKEYEEEKRRLAAKAAAAAGETAEDDEDTKTGEDPNQMDDEFITPEQKLKDLQLRLKRMVRDEEEKDKYIAELTYNVKVAEDTLDDLEPLVDKVKWQEVMEKRRTTLEQQQNGSGAAAADWQLDDNIVRRSDAAPKSKICAIM